jgi:hypothetical protein
VNRDREADKTVQWTVLSGERREFGRAQREKRKGRMKNIRPFFHVGKTMIRSIP